MLVREDSARAWLAMAPGILATSLGRAGNGYLPEEMVVGYFTSGGEKTIVCPAGTEVFFPSRKNQENAVRSKSSDDKRAIAHAIIFAPTVHFTLVVVGSSRLIVGHLSYPPKS